MARRTGHRTEHLQERRKLQSPEMIDHQFPESMASSASQLGDLGRAPDFSLPLFSHRYNGTIMEYLNHIKGLCKDERR